MSLYEIPFEKLNVNMKDVLGRGAYGTVYRGKWVGTDVAVKVIKRSQSFKTEMMREAEIHAKLHHPNIVIFMGVSMHKKDVALVTELVEGHSLQHVIDEEIELSEQLQSKIAIDIIKGISYLHEVLVVHSDIKPANILVSKSMEAKLCDFGIGKLKRKLAVSASLTHTGSLCATVTYMAPEAILHSKVTDFHSDVWSLGITLAEFLTLAIAWEELFNAEESAVTMIKNAMEKEQLPAICKHVPLKWKAAIEKCLKYPPTSRAHACDLLALQL